MEVGEDELEPGGETSRVGCAVPKRSPDVFSCFSFGFGFW